MIEQRKLIWIALSELYLDTELSTNDLDRLAAVFKRYGFELDEIRAIDLFEVFPVLQPNLLNVAGEWVGFEEEWFVTECQKRLDRRSNAIYRLRCHFFNWMYYWMRKDYWQELEKRM
jgi:hypothetical protein